MNELCSVVAGTESIEKIPINVASIRSLHATILIIV